MRSKHRDAPDIRSILAFRRAKSQSIGARGTSLSAGTFGGGFELAKRVVDIKSASNISYLRSLLA